MIDNIEFSDVKQVRKTLLITSFVGIFFKSLVKHSKETIEFFGFKISITDASIIPNLIGYLIIYLLIVLIIRYNDENLRKQFKRYYDYLEKDNPSGIQYQIKKSMASKQMEPNKTKVYVVSKGLIFIDFIFPLLLGIFTIVKIFAL